MNFIDKSWPFYMRSYSQEGEDVILNNYFENTSGGFYVDVGAHHPFRFSNTYSFYKLGWKGINIDATPGSMVLFNKYRPKDINLEIAIANKNSKINYYVFDEPALNSFSYNISKTRNTETSYKINKIIKLKTHKISKILDDYLPIGCTIDFLSIDVEGFELEVLQSNNWVKYRPRYILIEILEEDLIKLCKHVIYKYLKQKKYSVVAVTGRNFIFKRS